MFVELKINDVVLVECEELSYEGLGTIRQEKFTIFVYDLLPGETAKIKIIKKNSKILFAVVLNYLKTSPDRVSFKRVPSAALINLAYEKQIEFKNNYLRNLLVRNTKINLENYAEFYPATQTIHYRNKVRYKLKIYKDFLQAFEHFPKTNKAEAISNQVLNHPFLNFMLDEIITIINKFYQAENKLDKLRFFEEISLRTNSFEDLQVVISLGSDYDLPKKLVEILKHELPEIVQFYVLKNFKTELVYQAKEFKLELLDKEFLLNPLSFFQVNKEVSSLMFTKIGELNSNSYSRIIDAFCGVGVIGQVIANEHQTILGVDLEKSSIEVANKNAILNNLQNYKYIAGDAFKVLHKEKINNNDLIIFDPPRSGLGEEIVNWVNDNAFCSVIYMSCDPRTMVRDLQFFEKNNYQIKFIQGFDMFPNTFHIETLALLTKK
ncbi:23S rRNA (uracil(1939)-C(5))-methyltransferase RlmD [Mycoplasma hafezii]|uniref:23S rRNA (uracil(1939)-C(5))-methyltransferase RlmD n=1 Tax=Mycoplasma hafezii TaxID=525886 RepID=UPI003CECCBB4